jgi:hypothetical protein
MYFFKLTTLITLGILAAGCATVELPLVRDEVYPAEWSDISTLGAQCMNPDGTYSNEGIAVDKKGNRTPVMLTSLLERFDTRWEDRWAKTESVTISVVTKKLDDKGDSFATLQVVLNGDLNDPVFEKYAADFTDQNRLERCPCVKNTLVVGMRRQYSYGFPYLGVWMGEMVLWLTKASDGSLIVRIKGTKAGIALPVPYAKESFLWARFKKVEEK